MNCWHCKHELIWGGDSDTEDDEGNEMIETNLTCPGCESFVLVYAKVKKRMTPDPKKETERYMRILLWISVLTIIIIN